MGISGHVAKQVTPRVHRFAPNATASVVHEALAKAISGVGPLSGAAEAADKQLEEQGGDRAKAVREVIENNVALASAQGFVTNIGGLATMAFALPANVAGVAIIQCRMVAGIAHLRGYDLDDPRVRAAILTVVMGEESVAKAIKKGRLPARPLAIATAPTYDPDLKHQVAVEVVSELIAKAAGKRMVTMVGRRIPVVGGVVGASADGVATWKIGRYARRELVARKR